MAETKEGQAKLDKMLAAGMGRQQALKILINAQKKQKAAADEPKKPDPEPIVEPTPVSTPTATSAPASVTPTAAAATPAVSVTQVKAATPDLIQIDNNTVPEELMLELLFEDIGGQELLTVARHDTLSGRQIAYQPIKNINDIALQYSSESIIFMPESLKNYFKNFNIILENNVPDIGNQAQGSPNAYIDAETGDLVLEFKNVTQGQQVEVQMLSNAKVFDDTIYIDTGAS